MKTPHKVSEVCQTLQRAGFQSWVVGGAVRDSLMGRPASDWDITTNALPEIVAKIFAGFKVIPTGIDHGTVTLQYEKESYEITTFRNEQSYSDGRHPDSVTFLDSIEGDLARRDFTMNAVAFDPVQDKWADPFDGRGDIRRRVIRAVGNPGQRFEEDGLRSLRACRFAATLGFDLDQETAKALEPSLRSYKTVSQERVREEWLKAMKAEKPSRAFQLMLQHGLLAHTVPELLDSVGCKQNRYHEYDVWGHSLSVMDALPSEDPILRLTGLFHDVAKPKTKCFDTEKQDYTFHEHDKLGAEMLGPILNRLRFSLREKQRVEHLTRYHIIHYDGSWQDKTIRRWIRKITPDHLGSLFALARADIVGKGNAEVGMGSSLEELRHRVDGLGPVPTKTSHLAINGQDVMQVLGLSPGPEVGLKLRALLELVTNHPELNTREALLEKVQE